MHGEVPAPYGCAVARRIEDLFRFVVVIGIDAQRSFFVHVR